MRQAPPMTPPTEQETCGAVRPVSIQYALQALHWQRNASPFAERRKKQPWTYAILPLLQCCIVYDFFFTCQTDRKQKQQYRPSSRLSGRGAVFAVQKDGITPCRTADQNLIRRRRGARSLPSCHALNTKPRFCHLRIRADVLSSGCFARIA